MNLLNNQEITINEYRYIIKRIAEVKGIDFNDYSLISLKRRIECFLFATHIQSPDELIKHLIEKPNFYEQFLSNILVESSEMFRDPLFWSYIKNFLLPKLFENHKKIRIGFPLIISGDELYSLCIILHENNWNEKVELWANTFSQNMLEKITGGVFNYEKFEISQENYERIGGLNHLSKYCFKDNLNGKRDISLVNNVNFFTEHHHFEKLPEQNHLLIFRNRMLYFTQTMQDKVLKILNHKLLNKGYLAIGIKEQLSLISQQLFKVYNESENIYIKNNGI